MYVDEGTFLVSVSFVTLLSPFLHPVFTHSSTCHLSLWSQRFGYGHPTPHFSLLWNVPGIVSPFPFSLPLSPLTSLMYPMSYSYLNLPSVFHPSHLCMDVCMWIIDASVCGHNRGGGALCYAVCVIIVVSVCSQWSVTRHVHHPLCKGWSS